MFDFLTLAQHCAPTVHSDTMRRIVQVESAFNPYAIGVVGHRLERQPRDHAEAVATAQWLNANHYNFSVGLAQVNQSNFKRYGLTLNTAFTPCTNLRAGSAILNECFDRAKAQREDQQALRAAFSCYYSGNFLTGFTHGYVAKVVNADGKPITLAQQVPRFETTTHHSAVPIQPAASIALKTKPTVRTTVTQHSSPRSETVERQSTSALIF